MYSVMIMIDDYDEDDDNNDDNIDDGGSDCHNESRTQTKLIDKE